MAPRVAPSPYFWAHPIRYCRWAAHEKPAIWYSIVLGSFAPVILFGVPPIRRYFGDGPIERPPMTYPIPPGPRKIPEGYDDE
ncbi:hypothetical protein K402DRAFT_394763 [Aulographum hederae CBS 113979]|uniref:NADH-ubiquinone oxidoreductase 9.5 kDa subunit n=1 Tax=Aulographum hederae CBS 113979 TaxID=1176131 RepID=A0A6G1GWU3_9PEZI|nr:hypothetical protein K402DRAFT_394763 [Aulographum hederae CBS 113979]